MEQITDDIIEQAAGGDQSAFEKIYRAYGRYVYNVAWRIVHTHDDAEEVTQEVFITIYRKLHLFLFRSSFKTWVYRVTINTALNYAKKVSKARRRTSEFNEQVHAAWIAGDVAENIEKEHHEQLITMLLESVTPEQKACLILRNIEGLSYQEIADVLGININTVRSRLNRGRATLMQLRKEVISNEVS